MGLRGVGITQSSKGGMRKIQWKRQALAALVVRGGQRGGFMRKLGPNVVVAWAQRGNEGGQRFKNQKSRRSAMAQRAQRASPVRDAGALDWAVVPLFGLSAQASA